MGGAGIGHAAAALTEVEEVAEERRDIVVIVVGRRAPAPTGRPTAAAHAAARDLDLDANDRRAERLGDVRERPRQRARLVGRLGLGRHRPRRRPRPGRPRARRRAVEEAGKADDAGDAERERGNESCACDCES